MTTPAYQSSLNTIIENIDDVDMGLLSQQWQGLEQQVKPSFFLSWCWVNVWLRTLVPQAKQASFYLVRTYDEKNLIGLCIVSLSKSHYLKIIPSFTLRLQQTGESQLDQIWPEYNGVLVSQGREKEVYASVLSMLDRHLVWNEAIAGVITPKVGHYFTQFGLTCDVVSHSYSYCVDLESIRESGRGYLDSLSRNSRHQIRRSIKLYNDIAPAQLVFAQNKQQAQGFFDKIAPLHRERWGEGSGFNNPAFITFHQALIDQGFDDGQVELVCLKVGHHAVGYLYNFIMDGCLYFYLSAIDYSNPSFQDKRMKPGLAMHALRIQHGIDHQLYLNTYDFMGGDSRYKKSLAIQSDEMLVAHYRKAQMRFMLLSLAKKAKQAVAPVLSKYKISGL